jgi:Bacterial alpha-L-rhamnosidase 6 hairpin glycosidase domain
MIHTVRSIPLAVVLVLATVRLLAAQTDTTAPLAGVSNHGRTGDKPYVAAGDRAYLIGAQDGSFPDMGGHVRGEMGGLWLHPIKLIDGFRATVTDSAMHRTAALEHAAEFINYPYGNRLRYGPALDSLEIDRVQVSPDGRQGVVVQYVFRNGAGRARALAVAFAVKTDLLPVWYSDQLGIHDAPDTVAWRARPGVFIAHDRAHPWFAVWGAAPPAVGEPLTRPDSIASKGQGVTAASRYRLSVAPHDSARLTFVLAGSDASERDALASWAGIARDHAPLIQVQRERYASLLGTASISIPDRRLQQVYDWVRINTQWTVRDVPGIGRGVGGGLMEYPWWFGTETYTLQALIASGRPALAEAMLRLLRSQSQKVNGNGRILHEVTTNGGVSNRGNTQETAQFILTVGKVVQWTGDLAFAREMYPAMTEGLHWLLFDVDRNHDLLPEGYGITEILGLNAELIDAAAYTQQALAATARVAALLGRSADARRYRTLAERLETRINRRFWLPRDSSYADFYGTRAQAVSAADGAVKQIKLKEADGDTLTARDRERITYYERLGRQFAAMPDSSGAWITNKNWVVATPMEMGIAPPERARLALDKIRRDDVGEYGPFLSAVDRGAMMTISTGVLAVAEGRYGRIDRAKWYMDRIVDTFGRTLPGSISEMMPDYGCFVIAWTNYGIIVPLVEEIFGIAPDAPKRTVVFDPHVPSGWKRMSIRALPVANNAISFTWTETARGTEYAIGGTKEGWTYVVKADTTGGTKYYVNGAPVVPASGGIRMSGLRNRLVVVRGER